MLSNINKIRIRLIELDTTQAGLADAVGISPQYLCDILKGRRRPKSLIAKLAQTLDLPAALFEKENAA